MESPENVNAAPVQRLVHSPGPWSYSEQQGTIGHCLVAQVWDKEGDSLASIETTEDPRKASANAALIAAAPDLLAACKYLMDRIGEGTTQVFEQDAEYGQSPVTACELIEAAINAASPVV